MFSYEYSDIILGVCVSAKIAKATVNQPCSSGADCADAECCVSNIRPIGKRSTHGHCSSMGTSGSGMAGFFRYTSK